MGRLHQFAGAGGQRIRVGGRRAKRPSSLTFLGRLVLFGASAVALAGGVSYWFL